MPHPPKACRYCGKVIPLGSLYKHEHVLCEKRPTDGAPAPVVRVSPTTNPKMKPKTQTALVAVGKAAAKALDGASECCACILTANVAEVQLVESLVRDGIGLPQALARLGQVRAVYGAR